jgi:hypothetical protein
VPARWLTCVEPPLWPVGAVLWQLAALADAALTPYTALSRAGVGPSDLVVVVGNDARAHFTHAIAAAKGATAVADVGAIAPPAARDASVVVATSARQRRRALAQLGAGSTLVLLDDAVDLGAHQPESIDWTPLLRSEVQILTVSGGHPDLLPELAALLARGQLPLAGAVRRVAPADTGRAHAAYLAEGGPLPIAVAG